MDSLLERITQQAMNYAIRSGITISTGFAIREGARLLKIVKGSERDNIANLQSRLDSKIRIISPAIDMIELIAARGNTSLESAISLTKAIRMDIQALGKRLAEAADDEERIKRKSSKAKSRAQSDAELQLIIRDMKHLLERIEDAVPLINLAITTSGVNLSTTLPSTVSPSRLLQASTFLSAGDSQYAAMPGVTTQIGPTFVLSLYMLFAGHSLRPQDEESIRETTWKEVIHKARVKLLRVPLSDVDQLHSSDSRVECDSSTRHDPSSFKPQNIPSEGAAYEFAYQILVLEDLDDDRVHTFEEGDQQPGPFDDVLNAGIREIIPIHQISKIFYADTGKILNIGAEGEANNPVLLLKRDIHAPGPRRMENEEADDLSLSDQDSEVADTASVPDEEVCEAEAQLRRETAHARDHSEVDAEAVETGSDIWRFPPDLDPEWVALEVYVEDSEPEDGFENDLPPESASPIDAAHRETPSRIADKLSNMRITDDTMPPTTLLSPSNGQLAKLPRSPSTHDTGRPVFNMKTLPPIRTSLSLLELLIRLTALQQFQQASHLTITDELLNFFLSEASTTGAGADSVYRRQVRRDARKRVGFDPYDESPVKFHGEDYVREHAYYDPGGYDDRRTPAPGRSPRSPSGSPAMFRPLTSSRKSALNGSARSSLGSPAPSSPSPSLNRITHPRGPRAPPRHPQSIQSPAQIRLAPLDSNNSDWSDNSANPGPVGDVQQAEIAIPSIESPLLRDEHADSGLGTSPAEFQIREDLDAEGS